MGVYYPAAGTNLRTDARAAYMVVRSAETMADDTFAK